MNRPVAVDLEVPAKPGFLHHGGTIAADQHGLASYEGVMVIQREAVWMSSYCAKIGGTLTKILTNILQARQLEGADGDGIEIDHACLDFNVRIIQRYLAFGNSPVILAANSTEHGQFFSTDD